MEGQPQEQDQQAAEAARIKTLGVRIEEGLHAQLSFIAQLRESTIGEEIRRSIEARVKAAQDDPDLVARAAAVNAEMQREAEARRLAIAGFFGPMAVTGSAEPEPAATPTRRRNSKQQKPTAEGQS